MKLFKYSKMNLMNYLILKTIWWNLCKQNLQMMQLRLRKVIAQGHSWNVVEAKSKSSEFNSRQFLSD